MKNKEIEELLNYYQKEIDKYEESKKYLMEKYGYDEETIDNISQNQRYKNNKLLLSYIEQLENNRDKAIKFIEIELSQSGERELRDLVDGYEVLKLLKGGSDE